MSGGDGIVDLSAERARRAAPAPPVDPLFMAAEILAEYGQALFVHGFEHYGGDGPSDDESEEALVLSRQVRRLAERCRPAAGRGAGEAG